LVGPQGERVKVRPSLHWYKKLKRGGHFKGGLTVRKGKKNNPKKQRHRRTGRQSKKVGGIGVKKII